jgi:predicted transcriptional regulator
MCDTRLVIDLAELRRTVGITQVRLAGALATSQGQISRIESQRDMLLSTLTSYLAALGVDAKIVVAVGEQTVTYDLTVGRGKR